jgi:hypothetical protein
MGLSDILTGRKRAQELTYALIGAYAFSRLRDDSQTQTVMSRIYSALVEYSPFRISYDEAVDKFNNSPGIVQAGFMVNAMIDLGIHHGVRGFQWDYISNPFALTLCPDKIMEMAASNVRKYGIDPNECFSGPADV